MLIDEYRDETSAAVKTGPISMLRGYSPLLWRLALAAALVATELVLRAIVRAGDPLLMASGLVVRSMYCFLIAWPAFLIILAVTEESAASLAAARRFAGTSVNGWWLTTHFALVVPMVWPQVLDHFPIGTSLAANRYLPHAIAPFVLFALLRALAPPDVWMSLMRSTRTLLLKASLMAAAAALMVPLVQMLWEPASALTFALVKIQLAPFFPDLQVFPTERVLATNSLQVAIAEVCSGLEGVGLMLAFCTGWLWHLRLEFRFPRALLILPVAIAVAFLLNSVRISLLFAIAEFGFPEVATAGFHSQAGWIFFLAVAFLVAIVSRQVTWLQRSGRAPTPEVTTEGWRRNPVAAFLLPLLAILATGMLTSAISAGFETFYVLRLLACVMVLVIFRYSYLALDWRFGWRGIVGGVLVFGVWIAAARWLVAPAGMPAPLAEMSSVERALWIATRTAAAVIAVPIAEELAFRGFLLRRFASADFMSIKLQDATPIALLVSSLLFGFTHGSFWLPGILAGLVYGALARYTGRIGEAVVAHATTNALLVVAVLWYDQWQLW